MLLNGASATALVPLENMGWLSKPVVVGEPAFEPQMAVWEDNVYIVGITSQGIMFIKSTDSSQSFSAPVKLADFPVGSSVSPAPKIVAHNDNVYVAYTTGKDIFLVRSNNGGNSFSEPVNVSKMNIEEGSAAIILDHVLSVAGDRVYVAWTITSYDWSEIFFAQSHDGGASFDEHKNVSNNPERSMFPRIASFDNEVYLVWLDLDNGNINHVSFARSTDWGNNFETKVDISRNEDPRHSFEPQIAADRNTVYIVWRDEVYVENGTRLTAKVALAKSTDSGETFDITRYVVDGAWPALAVSGDNVYIAVGNHELGHNIAFVSSTDAGNTFSQQMMLSNHTWGLNPYDSRPLPQIAADGANVHVACRYTASGDEEGRRNHEVFLATSYDKGASFTKPLNVSKSPQRDTIWDPVIVSGSMDDVRVLWIDSVSDREEMMLVKGQIPEEYTAPYREVIYMTPGESYSPWAMVAAAVAAAGAAVGVIYYKKKH